MFYVIEVQTYDETGSIIPVAYADRAEAESKYHSVLAYASKSEVPKHGAMLCTDDLFILKSEVYNHKSVTPEE